jgi:hypothetical protein
MGMTTGKEYILQVAIKLNPAKVAAFPNKCAPTEFAKIRRAVLEEAYGILKKNPKAGFIRRSMINVAYIVGTDLADDPNNTIGGSVQYYEVGVFSVYVNVPVAQASIAVFAQTQRVKDTLECIAENKRVVNSMPA